VTAMQHARTALREWWEAMAGTRSLRERLPEIILRGIVISAAMYWWIGRDGHWGTAILLGILLMLFGSA
jgi:hypothetical protein